MFAVKGYAKGTEEQPSFLVVGCGCADEDVDAGNHAGRVSVEVVSLCWGDENGGKGVGADGEQQ